MKHRVEIDVSFDNEQDAKSLLQHVEEYKTKAYIDDPAGKLLYIVRKGTYTLCGHDENPPAPCSGYINVDFDGAVTQHTWINKVDPNDPNTWVTVDANSSDITS